VGNSTLFAIGTYTGLTYVNGGTVQLASGIGNLGATGSTGLTHNAGTFDINGNSVGIGGLNGGPSAIFDNTAVGVATLFIGNGNATGVYNGTIKNTGGALTITKV